MRKTNRDYATLSEEERYNAWKEIIATAKEVNKLSKGNQIRITCEKDKYEGWQGTMKPSY